MGRAPCCEKDSVKRGPWTPEEDAKLLACIAQHGTGSWRTVPKKAGLQMCGKSCRLRWTNYLRPDLKHGSFSEQEEQLIVKLHAALGSRWSLIAAQLPGRTDNDVKNYWNTRLKKKLCEMGIDPITHKPISQLLADLAGSITLPKGSEIAEATLGCFKDDMLNVLMRKRTDQHGNSSVGMSFAPLGPPQSWELQAPLNSNKGDRLLDQYSDLPGQRAEMVDVLTQKIKSGLSTAIQSKPLPLSSFMSAPCGPVSGVRSATGALARSRIQGQQLFLSEGVSSAFGCPNQFAFSQDEMPKSMLDIILEPRSSTGPSASIGEYEKEVLNLNLMNARSRSNNLAASTAAEMLPPADISMAMKDDDMQRSQFLSSDSLSELTTHQHLYVSLLQQQEHNANLQQPLASGQGKSSTIAATMGQNNKSETIAWSPSCSGSSSSSTSLIPVTDHVSSLEGVLNSDALLWDLSEFGSMVS